MNRGAVSTQICPHYHKAIELIGRRWTGAILSAMLGGATRYTDIIHAVPGLSDRLLSERLKELEAEGIVVRQVHPDIPVRIEYHLTAKGRDLGEVTDAVSAWAHRWAPGRESGVGSMDENELLPTPYSQLPTKSQSRPAG